jgi:hypothetical protein
MNLSTKVLAEVVANRFMFIPDDTPDYVIQQIGRDWAARTEAEYTYASVKAIEDENKGWG